MSNGDAGFSLIEVTVAALILATGVLATAQLLGTAAATNVAARSKTMATVLAGQKLEQLVALGWSEFATGGSISSDAPGFVEEIGATGMVVSETAQHSPLAVYTRRWAIESQSEDVLVVRVRVVSGRDLATLTAWRTRRPE